MDGRAGSNGAALGERIRARLPELPASLQRVGHVLLSRQIGPESLTVEAVASAAGVSLTTVVRFCRDMGYRGFKDLRTDAIRAYPAPGWPSGSEGPEHQLAETRPMDPAWEACARAFEQARVCLAASLGTLDRAAVARAARLLGQARLVVWFGVGASGLLARAADFKFGIAGFNCRADTEPQLVRELATRLGPSDVLGVFSHTGRRRSVLEPVEYLRARGGPAILAITDSAKSPLARLADVVLVTADQMTVLEGGQLVSFRPAQEALINGLLVASLAYRRDAKGSAHDAVQSDEGTDGRR